MYPGKNSALGSHASTLGFSGVYLIFKSYEKFHRISYFNYKKLHHKNELNNRLYCKLHFFVFDYFPCKSSWTTYWYNIGSQYTIFVIQESFVKYFIYSLLTQYICMKIQWINYHSLNFIATIHRSNYFHSISMLISYRKNLLWTILYR